MVDLEKRKLWDERIEAFLASGPSRAAWCREQVLPAGQLSYWLRKLKSSTSTTTNNRWISVRITTTTGKSGVSLRIGNIALEIEPGFDAKVLSDLIRSVMALCIPDKKYLSVSATDMRKAVDGLTAIVQLDFELSPFEPCLFAFCNRKRNKVKILEWSGLGFWAHCFRLEQGSLPCPQEGDKSGPLDIIWQDLCWILEGRALELR